MSRRAWIRRATFVIVCSLGIGLGSADASLASIGTKQVDVTRRGGDPSRDSGKPSVSADGRYVSFWSLASDLVSGDRNGEMDVFVRDVVLGNTTRVSVDMDGGDADGASGFPAITPDGRFVAFSSDAPDLVPDDGNGTFDIFLRDLLTATTFRASVDAEGGDPNGFSLTGGLAVTPDGRYVAFDSYASDLVVGDDNHESDVFVRDMVSETTTWVSVDTQGGAGNGFSGNPSISAEGRHVAFRSSASDLVAGDGNGDTDVFVRDLLTGTTTRVSVDVNGGDANSHSYNPSMSGDGRYVAFYSGANDLVEEDGNPYSDVFVRDLTLGVTTRASVDYHGHDAEAGSFDPSISADGRYVAFLSDSSDLIPDDGNDLGDVFVRDLLTGVTIRASVDVDGGDPNHGASTLPSISASGDAVAFRSMAADLVPGPGDKSIDVYLARVD
jgi:Tol biopolymer transport system component